MATMKYSRNNKNCATCNYWEGLRKVDNVWSPMNVIIEGKGAEEVGVCGNRKSGGRWNGKYKANYTCPYFDLFARLKSMTGK
jgi:hypothetical protein